VAVTTPSNSVNTAAVRTGAVTNRSPAARASSTTTSRWWCCLV